MMASDYKSEDAEAFASLAMVFQSSKLETLNLSDNSISASLWRNWAVHTHLRQLILDYVHMDDESLQELQTNFTFADSLEELYVVWTNHVGSRGLKAANNILRSCRKVSSLRWAVKDAPPDAVLPWYGLADMVQDMGNGRGGSNLLHLVMDGGTMTPDQAGTKGLSGAMKYFTQLKTLKLRSVGLNDNSVQSVVASLMEAQPPLESIDLSRNQIQSQGAKALARMCEVDSITKNLAALALDRNSIEEGGARALLEAFGSCGNQKLDLKLDGNMFHYGKVAFSLACRMGQATLERDTLSRDLETMKSTLQEAGNPRADNMSRSDHSALVHDLRVLQDEVTKLRAEKASLIQAFSVMGALNQVRDQMQLVDRIAVLEKSVFGAGAPKRDNFHRSNSRGDEESSQRSGQKMERRNSLGTNSSRRDARTSVHCDSPGGRSASQRRVGGATTPSNRRIVRDIGATQDLSNVLVRDISERWGTSPSSIKNKPLFQIPAQQHMYGQQKHRSKGSALDLGGDDGLKTNHSRSTHSDRFQGQVSKEYTVSGNTMSGN
jgi:Leucine Rich repeat